MIRRHNAGIMLAHRLRRWPNITLTLDQRLAFAISSQFQYVNHNFTF